MPDGAPRRRDGAADARPRSGFRSQPRGLKILLIVSLAAIVAGVVRCSIEIASVGAPISSIGVQRASVDLDGAIAGAPPDSVAARASRVFAEALREHARAEVRLASPGTRGFDALARLRISGSEGGIRVAVGVVHTASGRALFETRSEGPPETLEGLLNGLALRTATALGIARERGADPARSSVASGGR
jgi:hypothetical protein